MLGLSDGAWGWLLSSLVVSTALATLAFALQRRRHRAARICHVLWVLALVKLVTPPLWGVPLVPLPGGEVESVAVEMAPAGSPDLAAAALLAAPARERVGIEPAAWSWSLGDALGAVWILGALVVSVVGLARIARFHRWWRRSARPAPMALQQVAARLATSLRLRRTPPVVVVDAHISPMVWWRRGRAVIGIPEGLVAQSRPDDLRWILAHELGHVRRRDHWVRWLEAIVGAVFWWNPVVWWARRNLRQQEEISCDGLVLETFRPAVRSYANALLTAVEFLAGSAHRPPIVASAMTGGGVLERRFQMIMSHSAGRRVSRWTKAAALALGVGLLPAGIAYAQAPDFESVGSRLVRAVRGGEVSPEQAEEMMAALARIRFHEMLEERGGGRRSGVARSDAEARGQDLRDRANVLQRYIDNARATVRDAERAAKQSGSTESFERAKSELEALRRRYVEMKREKADLQAAIEAEQATAQKARAEQMRADRAADRADRAADQADRDRVDAARQSFEEVRRRYAEAVQGSAELGRDQAERERMRAVEERLRADEELRRIHLEAARKPREESVNERMHQAWLEATRKQQQRAAEVRDRAVQAEQDARARMREAQDKQKVQALEKLRRAVEEQHLSEDEAKRRVIELERKLQYVQERANEASRAASEGSRERVRVQLEEAKRARRQNKGEQGQSSQQGQEVQSPAKPSPADQKPAKRISFADSVPLRQD